MGDSGTILKTTNGGSVSIEEIESPHPSFTIYSNPANSKITIEDNGNLNEDITLSIVNNNGQEMMHRTFRNQIELDVSPFSKGINLVKIQTKAGIEGKKLIIR